MRPLLVLSARWVALAVLVVLGLGALGGTIRLLPWLVAPDVPLELAAPFARRVAQAAGEVAVVVGVPVGLSAATARFVERGEARALFSVGSSPARLALPLAALGASFVLVYGALSVGVESEPPGRLAARLVLAGRDGCEGRAGSRVEVPLVGVAWLCFSAGPRLVGRVPGVAREAWFSASEVEPSDDLRQIGIGDLHVATRFGTSAVSLHAGRTRVGGLAAWGAPTRISAPARAVAIATAAWLVGMFAAWWVLARSLAMPVGVAAVAALAAGSLLAAIRAFDGSESAWPLYGVGPALAAAVFMLGVGALGRLRGRLIARRAPR